MGLLALPKRVPSSVTSGTAASSSLQPKAICGLLSKNDFLHHTSNTNGLERAFLQKPRQSRNKGVPFSFGERSMWPDIWRLHLTTLDLTLTTHDVRTKSGPTTPWRHTMSGRSQYVFNCPTTSDDTRCQNEVRRKSDDVRPSLRAGSPFNTNLGDCTSSHSFLSTHAHVFRRCTRKGTLLSFPPLSFFHSNPAECYKPTADTPPP